MVFRNRRGDWMWIIIILIVMVIFAVMLILWLGNIFPGLASPLNKIANTTGGQIANFTLPTQ